MFLSMLLLVGVTGSAPPEPHVALLLQGDSILAVDETDFSVRTQVPLVSSVQRNQLIKDALRVKRRDKTAQQLSRLFADPDAYWFTADGTHLVLVSARSYAVVNLVSMTAVGFGEVECPSGDISFAARTPEGRSGYFICDGVDAKKADDRRAPSLFMMDVDSGSLRARRELRDKPYVLMALGDGRPVTLFRLGTPSANHKKTTPATLETLDPGTLETLHVLTLPPTAADAFGSSEKQRLYVIDPGVRDTRPERSRPGRVLSIDPATAQISAELDAGLMVSVPTWDPDRQVFHLFARLSGAPPSETTLLEVDGDAIRRRATLSRQPVELVRAPDGERYYVLDEAGVSILDQQLEAVRGFIPLSPAPAALAFLGPDRAYVSHSESGKVSDVDLAGQRLMASLGTGRGSVKFGQVMKAIGVGFAVGMNNAFASQGMPHGYGPRDPAIGFTQIPPTHTRSLVAPDGRTVFVFNARTRDVTVIDVATHSDVAKIGGGRWGMELSADGRHLVFWDDEELKVLDTATREVKLALKVTVSVTLCPSGRHAYLLAEQGEQLTVVDLETGQTLKTFGAVRRLIVFKPQVVAIGRAQERR